MTGTRTTVNGTQEYLTGDKIGTLSIGLIENRHPLRWHAKCERCGVSSVYTHEHLTRGSARCANTNCNLIQGRSAQNAQPSPIDWGAFAGNPRAFEMAKEQDAIAKEKARDIRR